MARGGRGRLIGLDAHLKRLQRMAGPQMEKAVGAALFKGAEEIASEAKKSITTGTAGGNSGGKHQHQPSAEGTPPNNFSGNLEKQINAEHTGDPLEKRVTSNAQYAAIQEFGGTVKNPGGQPYFIKDGQFIPVSKQSPHAARLPKTKPHDIILPARPYMQPARDTKAKEVEKLVTTALNRLNKGSGGKK